MTGIWTFAIDADDVEEEDVMPVEIAGRELAIYRAKGNFYASNDRCTHGDAYLSEGVLVDEVIECPLHQGRFCIKSGKALSAPVSAPIEVFETKLDGGKVYVRMVAK